MAGFQRLRPSAALLVICLLAGAAVGGYTFTWTGNGNGSSWASFQNWTFTCPPGQYCDANQYPDDATDHAILVMPGQSPGIIVPTLTIGRLKAEAPDSLGLTVVLLSDDTQDGDKLTVAKAIIDAVRGQTNVELKELLEINTE